MIITINTKTKEIREKWSKEDKQMEHRAVQREKLEAVSMALAAQLVVMYDSDGARERVLATIFTNLIYSMRKARINDSTTDEEKKN